MHREGIGGGAKGVVCVCLREGRFEGDQIFLKDKLDRNREFVGGKASIDRKINPPAMRMASSGGRDGIAPPHTHTSVT